MSLQVESLNHPPSTKPAQVTADEVVSVLRTHPDIQEVGVKGNNSRTYLVPVGETKYFVKAASGSSLLLFFRRHMLRREYSVYRRLAGVSGLPKCYGLVDGHWLVLEYIESKPFRRQEIVNKTAFFQRLKSLIDNLHAHGVAHGDLKENPNILVLANETPYLADFGIAVTYRAGFHPLNHLWFRTLSRIDINAYLRHKYGAIKVQDMDETDQPLYRRTIPEKTFRTLREGFKWLT
ncbi:MAG: hypothetical protein GXP16_11010, partial [Gammaproteobacteria bacterium]|nr:hypothetical protein [Gammaproteobacteria bacterium]